MKYQYQGINEMQGCVAGSEAPIEEWGYETQITISRAERLSERGQQSGNSGELASDSLNTTNK